MIGAAILKTEAELVLAHRPGERVRDLAGDVVAARGRRDADRVETVDGDLRSAGQSSARVQTGQRQGILAVHRIGKVLREVVGAGGKLVAQVGAEAVIPDQVVVLDVRGNGLEVFRQVGADEDAARSIGIALAEVPDRRKVAAVAEVVVDVGHDVVAVAALRRAAGVVARCGGKVGNVASDPTAC